MTDLAEESGIAPIPNCSRALPRGYLAQIFSKSSANRRTIGEPCMKTAFSKLFSSAFADQL